MPAFSSNPNDRVLMLQPGVPSYAFGSKNLSIPTCHMKITNTVLTSGVVTLTVLVVEGNIPAVGDLITVQGTSNAGGVNVTAVALASVSITAATGVGTVTFPFAHANITTAVDTGDAYVAVPEVGEALAVGKSQAFGVQNIIGQGYGISWSYSCSPVPSTIAIQLEGAINNVESEYTIIGSSVTTAAGAETFATLPALVNFVRLNATATTGGSSPKIVGKILRS